MKNSIVVASPLRKFTNGESVIPVKGEQVFQVLLYLREQYPLLVETICNDDLSLKPIVTIYKDDEDISYLGGLHTELKERRTALYRTNHCWRLKMDLNCDVQYARKPANKKVKCFLKEISKSRFDILGHNF